LTTGAFYVGSTCNQYGRFKNHRNRLRRGAHHCKALQEAWNQYGESRFAFCVVSVFETEKEAKDAETTVLQEHVGTEQCYNTGTHADAPWRGIAKEKHPSFGVPVSEEQRKQISETLKEYYAADPTNHPRAGKRHTAETRAKISEKIQAALERGGAGKYTRSEETRKKLSEALKGNSCALGYKRTPEERSAMSERMKGKALWLGKKHSEESRIKMGKRLIVVLPDGKEIEYSTISHFRREYDVTPPTIARAIASGKPLQKGKLKGYVFRYA
jgi:group I intron endonuclease